MNEEERDHIEDLFKEYNPHVFGGEIKSPDFHRDAYHYAMKLLKISDIIAITGPQGAGKTTIMKQMMKELKDPAFFSFERPETRNTELLDALIDSAVKNSIEYLFLDEIQFAKGWDKIIHRYTSSEDVNLKLILSSSQSIYMSWETGRPKIYTSDVEIGPLSFREFLRMSEIEFELYSMDLMDEDDLRKLLEEHKKHDGFIMEARFREYLFKGGFPVLAGKDDEESIQDYILSNVKKIIYEDIPYLFEIKKVEKIEEMLTYISNHMGRNITISSMAKDLKIDKRTAEKYRGFFNIPFS